MARVGVITPVFNGVSYIDKCVANVAEQGVEGIEHVVADGGSTDGTIERLEVLRDRWPHLRFVSDHDNGQSDAMNKGVKLSDADILGVLNVDDFYAPSAIAEAVSYLEAHPDVDIAVGDCQVLGENDVVHWINRPCDLRIESLVLGWNYNRFPVNPSAYFYRRRVHDLVGMYDTSDHLAMDVAFIFACASKTRMAYVPRVWGNYRHIAGTKTFEDQGQGPARVKAICERYKAGFTPGQRFSMRLIKSFYRLKHLRWRVARRLGVASV